MKLKAHFSRVTNVMLTGYEPRTIHGAQPVPFTIIGLYGFLKADTPGGRDSASRHFSLPEYPPAVGVSLW